MPRQRYEDLVEPGRAHRLIYVDPDIFSEEMVSVFAGTWVCPPHESEIAPPNDFRLSRLGLRPIIVTRDGDGEIHALFNRCAHRGSTVCQEERGNARRFQCSYHGWTYSSSGDLFTVPFESGY